MASGSFDAWRRAADAAFAAAGSRLRIADLDPSEVQAAFDSGETPHDFANRDHRPVPRPAGAGEEWIGRALKAAGAAIWIFGSLFSLGLWADLAAERQEMLQKARTLHRIAEESNRAEADIPIPAPQGYEQESEIERIATEAFEAGMERARAEAERARAEAERAMAEAKRKRRAAGEEEDDSFAASQVIDGIVNVALLPPFAGLGSLAATFAAGLAFWAAGARWNRG